MKVLFISGFSKDADSANVNCIREVVQALRKHPGVEVTVTGEVLKVQRANVDWRKKPSFMLRKIFHWPVIDPDASDECYKIIVKELNQTKYDAMIVSHMPYDAVLAAVKAKKKYPQIHLMLYELDPITYEIDKKRNSLGRYLYFMREIAEKRTYIACDTLLHMECNRQKYSSRKYKDFSEKSVYIDFPLIHDMKIEGQSPIKYAGQLVRFIYAGKLMRHFRSPEYLLKVLSEIKKSVNMEVDFFTNGDCESLIEKYAHNNSCIQQFGYVDKATLNSAIDGCDYLINIGNKYSDMLPSKLLSYIETGMPILHVQNQANDACIAYLKRYKNAIIISENAPVEDSADKVVSFIRSAYKARVCSGEIIRQFHKNTPEFSAGEIFKRIQQ